MPGLARARRWPDPGELDNRHPGESHLQLEAVWGQEPTRYTLRTAGLGYRYSAFWGFWPFAAERDGGEGHRPECQGVARGIQAIVVPLLYAKLDVCDITML